MESLDGYACVPADSAKLGVCLLPSSGSAGLIGATGGFRGSGAVEARSPSEAGGTPIGVVDLAVQEARRIELSTPPPRSARG